MTDLRKNAIRAAATIGTLAAGLLASGPVSATLFTYFGEDLATGRTVPPGGNAATAKNSFVSALSGFGTEDFEGMAAGIAAVPPYNLGFPGTVGPISATLTTSEAGTTNICGCVPPASGQFATSGIQWLTTGSNVNIAFNSAISAFGFFGTDVGDTDGHLTLTLTLAGGATVVLDVPGSTVGRSNNANGDLLFFGFVDSGNTYTNIALGNSVPGREFYGIDDIMVADAQQVAVAEPAGTALFAMGLLALGWARRRTCSRRGLKLAPYS